jgi:type III secretion protein T
MTERFPLQSEVVMLTFAMPRIVTALLMSPFFSDQFIQGIARQVVSISLTLVAVPLVAASAESAELMQKGGLFYATIIAKEIALGMVLGFGSGLALWIAQGTGFFIDNQRGSSMAEAQESASGSTTSPYGLLFAKIITVLFFVGGGFHAFLTLLFESYRIWPVFTYFPTFNPNLPLAALGVLDSLMNYVVLFAGPLIVAMFIAEFGLGLVNRFSPQLNVFSIAMAVKSGVASILIIAYLGVLVGVMRDQFVNREKMEIFVQSLFR